MASSKDREQLVQAINVNSVVQYPSPANRILPSSYRNVSFGHAITLTVIGVATMGLGIIIYPLQAYSIVTFFGFDIWMGLLYTIAGSLGIATYRNPLNHQLFTAYFAFVIIATMTAVGHVGVSVLSFFYPSGAFWSTIASTILAGAALFMTLSCIIILSIAICCNQNQIIYGNVLPTGVVIQPSAALAQNLPPAYTNTTSNITFTPYVVESRSPYVTNQAMPVTSIINPKQL